MHGAARREMGQGGGSGTGLGPTQMFQNKCLVDNGIGFVLGATREGYLYVRFAGDDSRYAKLRFELDALAEPYNSMLRNWEAIVTEEELAPGEDDLLLREGNMTQLFAVTFLDKSTRIGKKLYRVQIRSADPVTQKVKVYCVDEHMELEVNASELIPLDNLHPDLSSVAPMIGKVHLHGIKMLRTKSEIVKNILTGEMLKMSLVHAWPEHAHPPEVSIDTFPAKVAEESPDQVGPLNENQLTGLSKYFVGKGCAEAISQDEMMQRTEKEVGP